MESKERTIAVLETEDGSVPFADWLLQVRDKTARQKIESRLYRASLGNFGDWKELSDGVFEMRIDYGPGYRLYFAIHKDAIIVILIGGVKTTQDKDIKRAIQLWKDNKDETERFQRRN